MEEDDDKRGLQMADLLLTMGQAERLLRNAADLQGNEAVLAGDKRDTNPALLGLTPHALRDNLGLGDDRQLRAHEEAARLTLLPRIEKKLRVKCSELCDIMLPGLQQALTSTPPTSATTKSASSSSSISRVAELPALLLEAKARKAQVERETLQLKEHLHSQLLHDLMRCKEMTSLVSQLLIDHKRNDQPRVLHAKLHWLASVSNVMRLKAQVLANELTVETYPPHKLEILRATHAELQKRRSKALEERDALQTKLQLYRHADAQYQSIAQEYGAVLQSIEEKKNWLDSLAL